MSFKTYIASTVARNDARGDFIRDARLDPAFPDASTWREVEVYLDRLGAISGAIDAGRDVWEDYRRSLTARPIR